MASKLADKLAVLVQLLSEDDPNFNLAHFEKHTENEDADLYESFTTIPSSQLCPPVPESPVVESASPVPGSPAAPSREIVPGSASKARLSQKQRTDLAKRARDRGEAYVSYAGKPMPGRRLRSPCPPSCRLNCAKRLSPAQREALFREFWSLPEHRAKWDFIARNVRVEPKQKETTRWTGARSRRTNSRQYYFQRERQKVCKTMFLNTLGISNAWIGTVCKKLAMNGCISEDGRGKIGHRRKKSERLGCPQGEPRSRRRKKERTERQEGEEAGEVEQGLEELPSEEEAPEEDGRGKKRRRKQRHVFNFDEL